MIGAMAALLVLGACGGGGEKTMTTEDGDKVTVRTDGDNQAVNITSEGKDGTTGTFAAGDSARWPADAPAYAPAYPGAKVEGGFSGTTSEGATAMTSFSTADAPDKVVEFYKARAAEAGLADVSTMDMGGQKLFTASDKASGRSLMVSAGVQEGKTAGSVTYAVRPAR
jgi:hypothetical protein